MKRVLLKMKPVHSYLRAPLSAFRESLLQARFGIPYIRFMDVGNVRFRFLIGNVEGHRWFSSMTDFTHAEGAATVHFASHAAPGSVVVDVGAHHGFYTLVAASHMRGEGVVVAIEAERANCEILQKNIVLNRFTNVCCHCAFAGNTSQATNGHRTCRLDDLLQDVNPTLLKIDVEGAENQVLDGATGLIERARPIVLCEVHPAKGADVAEIIRFFRLHSYELWVVHENNPNVIERFGTTYKPLNDILIAEPSPL